MCKGQGALNCDDDNPCTTDYCSPASGCIHDVNDVACDDGNVCTVGDKCEMGSCKGGVAMVCGDGNVCTDDSCDPVSGCKFSPNNAVCDDMNKCTSEDLCQSGQCVGAKSVSCDDSNICTLDTCSPVIGCVSLPVAVVCSDDNVCTVGDQCVDGVCTPGTPLNCNDGNVCTQDDCDANNGCNHIPIGGGCDDGNACTVNDSCVNGGCMPGDALDCNDGDKCTNDSCSPDTGCVHTPITPCCGNGIKEGGEQCDDGNQVDNDGCKNNCTNPVVKKYRWKALGKVGNAWGGSWKQTTCNAGIVNKEYVGNGPLDGNSSPGPHNLYGPCNKYTGGSAFYKVRCVYE